MNELIFNDNNLPLDLIAEILSRETPEPIAHILVESMRTGALRQFAEQNEENLRAANITLMNMSIGGFTKLLFEMREMCLFYLFIKSWMRLKSLILRKEGKSSPRYVG